MLPSQTAFPSILTWARAAFDTNAPTLIRPLAEDHLGLRIGRGVGDVIHDEVQPIEWLGALVKTMA